ncbi:hypothetical protein JJV70_04275 [Streptomyces sp. JJ66]|uniref:hypothetical protein n=1 Tax=Streptomyces sp. JJ66 TaxID=2803843 RepID=UPI001C56A894|nr:hypothetical protein [Streptomyces sp. JJ66]MBW1601331.1 hypothetical protein [Streptomyces sp. JJ66]
MTTTRSDESHEESAAPQAATELHRLLGSLLQRLPEPAAEELLTAIRAELNARETRAYAHGWQDAMEATTPQRT